MRKKVGMVTVLCVSLLLGALEMYVTMPTSVPGDFPVVIRVRAEHADGLEPFSFPLRIEQKLR